MNPWITEFIGKHQQHRTEVAGKHLTPNYRRTSVLVGNLPERSGGDETVAGW